MLHRVRGSRRQNRIIVCRRNFSHGSTLGDPKQQRHIAPASADPPDTRASHSESAIDPSLPGLRATLLAGEREFGEKEEVLPPHPAKRQTRVTATTPALFMHRTIHQLFSNSSDFEIHHSFLSVPPCLRGRFSHPNLFTIPFSSITGSGHSGQLFVQHTMMSALLAS